MCVWGGGGGEMGSHPVAHGLDHYFHFLSHNYCIAAFLSVTLGVHQVTYFVVSFPYVADNRLMVVWNHYVLNMTSNNPVHRI